MGFGAQVTGSVYRETGGSQWSCVANTSADPGPIGAEYEVQFHGNTLPTRFELSARS